LFSIKTLFVENLGHLAVNSGKLGIITICAEGVSAVEGVLIALEGHGGFTVFMVGTAQKVVGQQAVVRCAVVVEEIDVGLHVGSGEGLVVAVALVDAVQLSAHTVTVRLCGTAGERQENGYDGQQMSHLEYLDSVD
jgi:hypothetical protein